AIDDSAGPALRAGCHCARPGGRRGAARRRRLARRQDTAARWPRRRLWIETYRDAPVGVAAAHPRDRFDRIERFPIHERRVAESRWAESTAGGIHLRAADATATGSEWSLVPDPTAAAGRRAANVDRGAPKVSVPLSNPGSYVEWTFDADPGAYRIWIRGLA